MANTEGGDFSKFVVIKTEYVEDSRAAVAMILAIDEMVQEKRLKQGKTDRPKHLVINTDEPYADEVIEILKRHGHWG